MLRFGYLAAAAALLLTAARTGSACPWCKSPFKAGRYLGEARVVGNGVAYSWVVLDDNGKPSTVGATFTGKALEGLPDAGAGGVPFTEYNLRLPKEAVKTGLDHVALDWNPNGHEPKQFYGVPHFDVHFYAIPFERRERITAKGDDLARCRKKVPASYLPAGYMYAPGAEEPMMGAHWVDPTSPELHGQPFTATFIYGSYDGRLIFLEPMIAKSFLETRPDFSAPIKAPAVVAAKAYYPTRYTVRYNAARDEYNVAMEGLTWREPPVEVSKAKAKRSRV